jgi:hypothetical protein
MGEDRSEANLESLSDERGSVQRGSEEALHETAATDKDRPHLVSPREPEKDAAQLAATLVEGFESYLLNAERRVLNQTDQVCVSLLDDFERQRASVESLIGVLAERLGQQDKDLSALQRELRKATERLDRQAEAIRSVSYAQGQQIALVKQILGLLKHHEASAQNETGPASPEAPGSPGRSFSAAH